MSTLLSRLSARDRLRSVRSRRAQRGAALVEAAVVIPVMLVFLGTIMFTHRSYATKITKQSATRAGVLYYASHACSGDVPDSVSTQATDIGDGQPGPGAQGASKIGNTNKAGAESAFSSNGNIAKSTPAPTTVNGTAIQDHNSVVDLQRKIYAGSEVVCNEQVFPSKWTAVFQEIGSLYKSGLGFK